MEMKPVEPISRKLLNLGRAYINLLSKEVEHLDINRYYYALSLIYFHDGGLTQKALADSLGKDKSLIVNIINTLSEKGYVYREKNPTDRREHLLRVTDKAKQEVPEILAAFKKLNNSVTENIPDADMKIFYSVLHKMEGNLFS